MSEINYSALKSFGGTPFEQKYNALVDILKSITLTSSMDHRISRNATGTSISGKPISILSPDFSLYYGGLDGDGNPQLGVTNGTISGPDWSAVPDGFTEGGSPPYLITPSSGDKYAWIEIDWDTSGSTVTDVSVNTGVTVPSNDDSTQYITLGCFSISGTALTIGSGTVGIGSQFVQDCNATFLQGPT